jgi:hypothetical protein
LEQKSSPKGKGVKKVAYYGIAAALWAVAGTAIVTQYMSSSDAQPKSGSAQRKGDGPFGLDLSMPISELQYDEKESSLGKHLYALKAVPAPSSDFTLYAVNALPDAGICEVYARSSEMEGDSLGISVRAAADRVAAALTTKYGKPNKIDKCVGGDIFCAPENWSMSVMNGERGYAYEWQKVEKSTSIRSVALAVATTNLAVPFVVLRYEVNDKAKCEAASKADDAKNL